MTECTIETCERKGIGALEVRAGDTNARVPLCREHLSLAELILSVACCEAELRRKEKSKISSEEPPDES